MVLARMRVLTMVLVMMWALRQVQIWMATMAFKARLAHAHEGAGGGIGCVGMRGGGVALPRGVCRKEGGGWARSHALTCVHEGGGVHDHRDHGLAHLEDVQLPVPHAGHHETLRASLLPGGQPLCARDVLLGQGRGSECRV